jgi:hypothetical protein
MDPPVPADEPWRTRRRFSTAVSVAVVVLVAIVIARQDGPLAVVGLLPSLLVYGGAILVVSMRARRRLRDGAERKGNAVVAMGELFVAIAVASLLMVPAVVVASGMDWRLAFFGLLALPMLGLGLLVLRYPGAFTGFVR